MNEYMPLSNSHSSKSIRMATNHTGQNNGSLLVPLNVQNFNRTPSPENSRKPLLDDSISAPLAKIEMDTDSDEREVVEKPYPGIDDGFFAKDDEANTQNNNRQPLDENSDNPDVELIPTRPKEPEPIEPEFPDITPRLGGADDDGRNGADENDGKQPGNVPKTVPNFPFTPGFGFGGFDVELGSNAGGDSIPDLNVYQHKKTLAQGMMDLALFSANANQLRYVLETFKSHPYYYPSLILISISLILQVAIGVGLIWNATYNVKDEKALCRANKINNFTIIGIFLVTVINVFISAFGVASPPS